jgi:hypothetical protein
VLALLWVPLAITAGHPFNGVHVSTAVLRTGPHLWLLPVWWVVPTLVVAMPLLTVVGGLAAVARSRAIGQASPPEVG